MRSARDPHFVQPEGEDVKAGCFGGVGVGPGPPVTAYELETEVGLERNRETDRREADAAVCSGVLATH